MSVATHYDVLGVPRDVGSAELRRAYLALAQRHHPDRPGGDADRMRAVNEAWATLGDPDRRQRYDATLASTSGIPRPGASWPPESAVARDDVAIDLDDSPIGPTVVLPRWLALVPVGLFAASVTLFLGGVLIGVPAVVGAAVMCFALSTFLFLAAPFLALYSSRRPNR